MSARLAEARAALAQVRAERHDEPPSLFDDPLTPVLDAVAANAGEAYDAFRRLQPDVVVMDISLPGVSGIEGLRHILAREPRARVLMFSMHDEPIFATRAFAAGALGYVTKASAPEVLVDAVRAVAQGERYISADMAQALALQAVCMDRVVLTRTARLAPGLLNGLPFTAWLICLGGFVIRSIWSLPG